MSLSRRQFLVALGAGVIGGTQLERVAGLGDNASASGTLASSPRIVTPTTSPLTSAPSPAAEEPTAGNGASARSADKLANSFVTQSDESAALVRTPSQAATEWREISDDLLAEREIDARAVTVSAAQPRTLTGANLEGWRTVLGDSRHTAAGLDPVNADDVATEHRGDHSLLIANRHGRGVMAHNTSYLRIVDDHSLDLVHDVTTQVRTPIAPQQISGLPNGQTVEIALFAWDGKDSRRDIGCALQWVINPWSKNFGALRTWTSNDEGSRWSPDPVAWLDPNDAWQDIEMHLHAAERECSISINGMDIPAQCTETKKPDNWAYVTAAAMSVELISIWPDDRTTAPTTNLECRDWTWDWSLPV